MARPADNLGTTQPGIKQGQQVVTLADMGGVVIDTTLVAGSAGSVNTVLNSLVTSNVVWRAYPIKGYSYNVSYMEATDPTRSAVFISVSLIGTSLTFNSQAINIPSRLYLMQR